MDSVSEGGIPKVLGVPTYQSKGMRSDAAEPYYVKTADTDIVDGKTYYTLSGTTYSAVAEPAKANLGDYYEKITDKIVGVAGDWTKALYGTVEGMRHKELPLFSVQYHPEASPGPDDNLYLFDEFWTMLKGE